MATLVPGRYAKSELSTGVIDSIMQYQYEVEDIVEPVVAISKNGAATTEVDKSENHSPK